jgi:hypothetical protein
VLACAVVLLPEAFSGAIWINAAGVALASVMLGSGYVRRRATVPKRGPA